MKTQSYSGGKTQKHPIFFALKSICAWVGHLFSKWAMGQGSGLLFSMDLCKKNLGCFCPPSVVDVFSSIKINSYVQACISLQRLVSVAVIKWLGSRSTQRWQGLAAVSWPGPSILALALRGFFLRDGSVTKTDNTGQKQTRYGASPTKHCPCPAMFLAWWAVGPAKLCTYYTIWFLCNQ